MGDVTNYLAFLATCIAIIIVPGPTVTIIIANSLKDGVRAGMMNVAGTQVALATMLLVLIAGLETVVSSMGPVFNVIRIAGALYLIWLGIKLWRSDGRIAETDTSTVHRTDAGYFWQGFLVLWSNPKALLVFGAFIPQFVDTDSSTLLQMSILGVTFMTVGFVLDSAYAVAAGNAGRWLSRRNVLILERVSGSCLIAGGLWLALTRQTTLGT